MWVDLEPELSFFGTSWSFLLISLSLLLSPPFFLLAEEPKEDEMNIFYSLKEESKLMEGCISFSGNIF